MTFFRFRFPMPLRAIPTAPEELELPQGTAWSGASRRGGMVIHCDRGAVWITVEGDPIDHVLVSPGAFSTSARGRVVALALEAAHLVVGGRRSPDVAWRGGLEACPYQRSPP